MKHLIALPYKEELPEDFKPKSLDKEKENIVRLLITNLFLFNLPLNETVKLIAEYYKYDEKLILRKLKELELELEIDQLLN